MSTETKGPSTSTENRRNLVEAIAIAALILQITGYGIESRWEKITVILVAIAAFIAAELYGRSIHQLSDMWGEFTSVRNDRRRLSFAAVLFFTSLFIGIQTNLKAGSPLANAAVGLGILGGALWLLIETMELSMRPRRVQLDLAPDLPETFPVGPVFANLRAMAGPEATDVQLLALARVFSTSARWVGLCRHLIAVNMPDGGVAAEMIGQPNEFAWAAAEFGYTFENEHTRLFDRLLKATGKTHPSEDELMAAASSLSNDPQFLQRCAVAVAAINRRIRL